MIHNPVAAWRVPILMYHRVVEAEEDSPEYHFRISRRRLTSQMVCLRSLGYRSVSLTDVSQWLMGARRLPIRSVVITFDDGYEDTHRLAAPILERFGFTATVFAVADHVGGSSAWDADKTGGGYPLMGWDALRDLSAHGWTVGAHSRTHPSLPELDDARLRDEVVGSRRVLEERLGLTVETFAYPYNRVDRRVLGIAGAAGYRAACAGDGRGYFPLCLDRVDVSRAPLAAFIGKLLPWFHYARRARQRLRP